MLSVLKKLADRRALSPFSARQICSREVHILQRLTNGDDGFRFASREQIRVMENGL